MDFHEHLVEGDSIVFAFASENDFRFEWGNFLESIGVPHVLFRDCPGMWYMNGVSGLGSVSDVVDYIKQKSINKHSISLGLSKGGHAALRYGKMASIDMVIAISPVTVVDSGYDDFEVELHSRVNRSLPFQIDDLKPLFSSGPYPEIYMYFSDGHGCELDRRMIERLGVGNVFFVPGFNHGGIPNLATTLRDNGVLNNLIKLRNVQ